MVTQNVKRLAIASGATTSNAVDVRDAEYYAFEMPATFTGATFTVQGARGLDGTFKTVTDSAGTDLSITATDGDLITLSAAQNAQLAPLHFLRIVSAGAEGADREVWLHCR
jgi:hypothetical protein